MIYNLIIALYTSAVRLAALFNKKVALMVKGEKDLLAFWKNRLSVEKNTCGFTQLL